ncbi:Glycosyl transferases group 1 [Propionispora vibrioides]|uniref:Glycosyl transferases group 1 n=2 Tax=Propionispora vibrioides TaxID=112903 RepID=A0A1H8S121_9FIRM|nr:Glycosyl transferases group 1 [Propionispora vibrioides]
MRILYISDGFVNLSVFDSQVHTLCNYHAQRNVVTLLALSGIKEYHKSGRSNAQYSLRKALRLPKAFIPIINLYNAKLINSNLFNSVDIIHCRGHVSAAIAIYLKRKYKFSIPIIADIRGAIVDELKNKNSILARYYANQAVVLERFVFSYADFFFFVSFNMKKYYSDKYDISIDKSEVFPTIVDETYFFSSDSLRNKMRKKLNITDKFVYVYCGGTDYWQNIDKILMKFKEASSKDKTIFLLMLVKNPQDIKEFCHRHSIKENIIIMSVEYSEVGKYLNAADAGIIIRKEDIINFVASPTKVNEYLACGLRIIDQLDDIGNKNIESSKKYHYMPLQNIIARQQQVYSELVANNKR